MRFTLRGEMTCLVAFRLQTPSTTGTKQIDELAARPHGLLLGTRRTAQLCTQLGVAVVCHDHDEVGMARTRRRSRRYAACDPRGVRLGRERSVFAKRCDRLRHPSGPTILLVRTGAAYGLRNVRESKGGLR